MRGSATRTGSADVSDRHFDLIALFEHIRGSKTEGEQPILLVEFKSHVRKVQKASLYELTLEGGAMHLKLFLDNSLSYIFLRLFSKVIFRKNSL
jgi:hypothetical protein